MFGVKMNLSNCFKLCNVTNLRNVSSVAKKVLHHHNAPLLSTLYRTQRNCRAISETHQQLIDPCNSDITQTLLCFKYSRLIKRSIRESGPVIEENKKLETLLARANELKLPSDFIDFAMKISVDVRANVGLFEIFFLNNCHVIVQYEDIDLSGTKPYLMKLCGEKDAFLVQGNVKWPVSFEQKGIISVKSDNATSSLIDSKESQLAASKVGAQSVKQEVDAEGLIYYQFHCEASDLHNVKGQLIQEGYAIEEAHVGYVPKNKIVLSTAYRNAACSIINGLNKIPTIDNVFTNIM